MPHFRATVVGVAMEDLDAALREARVGVVIGGDVETAPTASGVPGEEPEVGSVTVSVDAADHDEARSKLVEVLPGDATVEILG